MALVASTVDAPPDNSGSNAEGDVIFLATKISSPTAEPSLFIGGDNTSNESAAQIPDFVAGSPPSSINSYSLLTYPLDHTGRANSAYMHSAGYGKSPEFVIRLPRESISTIGHPAVLECQIDGHPLPDIMWTKDDDDITDSEDPNYSFELDAVAGLCRLTIERCRESDQGIYRCILENCFGACSSTTSLTLTDNVVAFDAGSKSEPLATGLSQSPQPSPSSLPHQLQPQNSPSMVRELTTISEHLSQEETTTSLSASITSDSSPAINQIDEHLMIIGPPSPAVPTSSHLPVGEDTSMDASLTITNASATPLEVSTTNGSEMGESWTNEKEANLVHDEEISPDSTAGGTIRTVMNFDPPQWRQFCITPNRSEEEQQPSPGTPTLENDEVPEPLDTPNPTRSTKFTDRKEPVVVEPTPVVEEAVVAAYNAPQLMFQHNESKMHDYQEETNPLIETATDDNNYNNNNYDNNSDNIVPEQEAHLESDIEHIIEQYMLQEVATEAIANASQIDNGGAVKDVPSEDSHLSTSSALKVSFNNCEEIIDNATINIAPAPAPIVVPPMPIYRTMSSPSSVPVRRRGSLIDYFIDNNPKTRRRTLILQSLIALQITFLAILAVNWQEHLLEPVAVGTSSATAQPISPTAAFTTKAALTKAAMGKAPPVNVTTSQHVPTFFDVLTTPLSFVFVLIISSLFTFIFTSSIEL